MPALEKDMMEPIPSFRNLSQLIKMREKEKFYAKNTQRANEILENIRRNDSSKRIVKDGQQNRIISSHPSTTTENYDDFINDPKERIPDDYFEKIKEASYGTGGAHFMR